MFALGNKKDGAARQGKELQKLKRQDLLELLLEQMREGDALSAELAERELSIRELNGLVERLKDKLDLKDEQIEHLKDKLNHKDDQLAHLKAKLDDKDALIEKLKRRLDLKDQMIAEMMAQGREASVDIAQMEELLEAEERALEALVAAREAEPEPAVEPEPTADTEPAAESEADLEPAADPEPAPAPAPEEVPDAN